MGFLGITIIWKLVLIKAIKGYMLCDQWTTMVVWGQLSVGGVWSPKGMLYHYEAREVATVSG